VLQTIAGLCRELVFLTQAQAARTPCLPFNDGVFRFVPSGCIEQDEASLSQVHISIEKINIFQLSILAAVIPYLRTILHWTISLEQYFSGNIVTPYTGHITFNSRCNFVHSSPDFFNFGRK